MKIVYEAIITGDRITWTGERPPIQPSARVSVIVDTPIPVEPNGTRVAEAMRQMAERTGGISSIPDPVAWQREQRIDRTLPGREP